MENGRAGLRMKTGKWKKKERTGRVLTYISFIANGNGESTIYIFIPTSRLIWINSHTGTDSNRAI